jgi:8-oxo-dGTP pyrophosphatase MutT (NUDIX family)
MLIISTSGIGAMEERSAGAVVYRNDDNGRIFLLLQNAGRWDFPKGRVEGGV